MTDIAFRCLEINIRNARLTGQPWKLRRRPLVNWITSFDSDVVFIQEVTPEQLEDIKTLMGPHWSYVASHWCVVAYRNDRFLGSDVVRRSLLGPQSRGFAAVKLRAVGNESGVWFWAASTHLVAGRMDAYVWRRRQVNEIVNLFNPEEIPWVLMGASISSTRTPPHRGVRFWFQNHGLAHLRGTLRSHELVGEGENTRKGKPNSIAKGKWNDDIFSGSQVKMWYGRIELTQRFTDNNAIKGLGTILGGLQENIAL